MVGEIVHQIEEITFAKEAVLDPLVETVQVHHQIEMKGDHISALERIVHFQEEKGRSMKFTLVIILYDSEKTTFENCLRNMELRSAQFD